MGLKNKQALAVCDSMFQGKVVLWFQLYCQLSYQGIQLPHPIIQHLNHNFYPPLWHHNPHRFHWITHSSNSILISKDLLCLHIIHPMSCCHCIIRHSSLGKPHHGPITMIMTSPQISQTNQTFQIMVSLGVSKTRRLMSMTSRIPETSPSDHIHLQPLPYQVKAIILSHPITILLYLILYFHPY